MRVKLIGLIFAAVALSAAPMEAEDAGLITVTGEATAEVVPDMAILSLGVTREGADASTAMAATSEAMAKVLVRLEAAGVAERDLQTTRVSLQPRYVRPTQGQTTPPKIAGFIASNELSVRIRDLDILGSVVTAAIGDGANTLGGLEFTSADLSAARNAARAAAVADARARAGVLADAAGVTLGRLRSLSEAGGYAPPVPMARIEFAEAAMDMPVAAGEIGVRAQVSLVFEIAE